jgi:hypothetical protein
MRQEPVKTGSAASLDRPIWTTDNTVKRIL